MSGNLHDDLLAGNRTALARAITLIESRSASDEAQAQGLLEGILPFTGRARRIGITGIPGVGKSTFIENFGGRLTALGHRLAVLTIDPSSTRSGGSILGDKTRMEKLACDPKAFIRPSPAGDHLGGVERHTRETMLLCEAAGFDTIIVESVGVGQGEVALRSMVDFYLLLQLPGAGDELQGIKKGIIELADMVLINKAEGENRARAELARAEQETALHYSAPATPGWKTEVALCSAQTGEGLDHARERMEAFFKLDKVIAERRSRQALDWFAEALQDELCKRFFQEPQAQARLAAVEAALLKGQITVAAAVRQALPSVNTNHL
ncbi:MAG TPA: methylmalonyl Co-A mutase-associated GTPase MeaB [Verrucomicrobiae bacterium]|jgi:LAO/AO transport system kinase|nr:methylmalonyl Co-A mutase-associated GTPase MeaB [Verrucomicrobiae bacterium]